ncbi:MAG: site-specific DNA-methyltransferase [Thermoplasmatales archaeon]
MHVLDALKQIPDESVDFVMTSPPYYGLRSYHNADADWNGWKGQLGLEPTYQMYIDHLLLVTKELKRVLKKSGTLWWNMGDSYSGKMGSRAGWQDPKYSESREEGIEDGETVFLDADYGNIPRKSLMMIPERLAIGMIDQGWILRNKLIWYKRNGLPSSVKDRFSNKYEFVYFFVKSPRYYFNLDAVRKPLQLSSIKRINQATIDQQFQTGKSAEFAKVNPNMDIKKMLINMHQKYADEGSYQINYSGYVNADGSLRVNPSGANPGDIINVPAVRHKSWASNPGHEFGHERKYEEGADGGDFFDIPTMPHSFAHFAIYPETLVEPFMKAGCPPQGVVLDPFAGSGTTAVVGQRMGHSTISIEISPDYVEIIKQRMNWGSSIEDTQWEIIK